MNRNSSRAKPIDDVERLRQVRRQIEREHPTLDGLFKWLYELDYDRLARGKRPAKKMTTKSARSGRKGASARPRS